MVRNPSLGEDLAQLSQLSILMERLERAVPKFN
jgi:hypothetical protein